MMIIITIVNIEEFLAVSQSSSDAEDNYSQNLLGVAYKTSVNESKEVRDRDGKYVCTKCGKSYIAATSLSRHKRLECGVDPSEKCHICNRRFRHKFVLTAHRQNSFRIDAVWSMNHQIFISSERGIEQINQTTAGNQSASMIPVHSYETRNVKKRTVSGSNPLTSVMPHVCEKCNKGFRHRSHMRRHQLLCGNALRPYSFYNLDPFAVSYATTSQWFEPPMVNEKNLTCHLCQKNFLSQKTLLKHINSMCGTNNTQTYECEKCGKLFGRRDNMKRHYDLCGTSMFTDWSIKKEHVEDDTEYSSELGNQSISLEKKRRGRKCKLSLNFICNACGNKYARLSCLRRHHKECFQEPTLQYTKIYRRQRINEMNYFLYPELNYQSNDIEMLQANDAISILRRDQKLRLHFCSGCGRSYTRVDSLKRHQLKCSEYLTSSLQDNLPGRNDDREYFCENCGKSYRRRDTLQRHQRLVCYRDRVFGDRKR
ncbi:zinc finger protein 93 [Microplitis demolitor]|uniref:zinc finger protein 93 n=1 Tax=Microplitis demolitor TaxID=69319 RepID=UPI00235B6551|nr:zinc finger protein 93 [Microplitis demolitor]